MNLRDLASFVIGGIPRLSFPIATDIVKGAWEEVVGERQWSFLYRNGVLNIPAQLVSGSVSVVQFAATATLDATAKTAANASDTATYPIVGRQFRIGTDGNIYTILAYVSGTGVLTLDRAYIGVTNATSTYRMSKAYVIGPEGTNFKAWKSIVDPENSYVVREGFTKQEIDRKDPQRQSFGQPYNISYLDNKDPGTPGAPRYELWPQPTDLRDYLVQYLTRGMEDHNGVAFPLVNFEFPVTLNTQLLREITLYHASLWADKNKGRYDELKGINWRFNWGAHREHYTKMLLEAKKEDDNYVVTGWVIAPGRNIGSPIDAKFAQGNDVSWL